MDCNRNNNINAADTATATAYEFIGTYYDEESVVLTETGNSTGIFRERSGAGRFRSRGLRSATTESSI